MKLAEALLRRKELAAKVKQLAHFPPPELTMLSLCRGSRMTTRALATSNTAFVNAKGKDEHGHFLSGLGDWLLSGTDRHA